MVSSGVVNAFGIVGGAILTYMLVPQITQLWRTRRANDLSHTFMTMFNIGLLLTVIYNVWLKLWVFVVACSLQLALGVVLQAGKVLADRYQRKEKERHGRLAHSLSLRSSALEDFAEFAAGKSAAFPLLRPQPEHGAQHLLVDARLALPAAAADGMQAVAADADGKPGQEAAAAAFAEVAEMLQDALADAALLKGAPQQAPAVANGGSDSSSRRQAGEATEFFLCHDGYVAAVWHGDTAGLSVDCLAVTESSMQGMTVAAEAFCTALSQRFPGSRIAASSLGRLPAS